MIFYILIILLLRAESQKTWSVFVSEAILFFILNTIKGCKKDNF